MTCLDFWLGDDSRDQKRKSAETLVNLCIGVGRSAALADVPATRDGTTVGCTAATCVCRYESMQTTVTQIEAGFNKIAYECTPHKRKLGQV